jgi:predicted RNA-binding Zn-ribbon protein involved in translation (DUF1610 family)
MKGYAKNVASRSLLHQSSVLSVEPFLNRELTMSQDYKADNGKTVEEQTQRFSCPSCGGNMIFNPDTQSLCCVYCESKADVLNNQEAIKEYDFLAAEKEACYDWGNEKRVIRCDSCGAETVLDADKTSQFCAFCGSSHIVLNENSAGIRPESLVPFKISREKALKYFKTWIRKRIFAPRDLKSSYKAQLLSGVYLPHWTYDSDTYSIYHGEAGTYYYVTVTDWVEEDGRRRMVTRQERRIRWEQVSGNYSEYFNDILINASKNIDGKLMKKLEPFDLGELLHYKSEYLSGFLAERYSIGLKEGWDNAADFIKGLIEKGVIRKINADEVRNLFIDTSCNNIKFKHILLPVWISAYNYRNRVYRYLINGQTGEIQGRAPVSPFKVILTVLASLAILALIAFLLYKSKG